MAFPLLLLLVPIVAGGLIGGKKYQDEKKKAEKLEDVAQANQDAAEQEAQRIKIEKQRTADEREAKERNYRSQQNRERRKAEAGYAKSGVFMTGTPTNFLAEQARLDEFNAQEYRRQTKFGMKVADWKAKNTLIAGDNAAKMYKDQAKGIMKKAKIDFGITMAMSVAGGVSAIGSTAAVAATGSQTALVGGVTGATGGATGAATGTVAAPMATGAAGLGATAATGAVSSVAPTASSVAAPAVSTKSFLGISNFDVFGSSGTLKGFASERRTQEVLLKSTQGALGQGFDGGNFLDGLGEIF